MRVVATLLVKRKFCDCGRERIIMTRLWGRFASVGVAFRRAHPAQLILSFDFCPCKHNNVMNGTRSLAALPIQEHEFWNAVKKPWSTARPTQRITRPWKWGPQHIGEFK